MKKYRIAKVELNNGKIDKMLLYNDYDYKCIIKAYKLLELITLEVKGKTYTDKSNCLRELAIDYQLFNTSDCDIDLSNQDMTNICSWFEQKAKLYGLTNEFRENAII